MQKKFSENVCLRTKFDLRLKKKNKKIFGANFQSYLEKLLCCIWKLYGKYFFSNKFKISSTFKVCSTVLKKPQKWFNFFLLFFENV